MRKLSAVAAVVTLTALGWGCGSHKDMPFEPGGGGPDANATFTRVQNEVFTPSCARAGCHAGAAPQQDLDLSAGVSYGRLVRHPASEQSSLFRVAPGDPEASYLVRKLRGDPGISGAKMPRGGTLDPAKVQLVIDWVRRGAPND